tara:strand:+ start:7245 stop:9056 length:1812 start_codon:yes stop_codon:yes gene_type:complete
MNNRLKFSKRSIQLIIAIGSMAIFNQPLIANTSILDQIPEDISDELRLEIENTNKDGGNFEEIPKQSLKLGSEFITPDKFGYEYFRSIPTNISAIGDLPIPNEYKISLRDKLSIIYTGNKDNKFNVQVGLDGSIFLDEIGSISLVGETLSSAREKLTNLISQSYTGVKVDLSVVNLSGKYISILGAVNVPGSYIVNPFTTVSGALAYSGGFKEYSSLRNVDIIKSNGQKHSLDLYDLLLNGDRSNDIILDAGDTIVINATDRFIDVNGSVLREHTYEYKEGETLEDLIRFSLGFNSMANKEKVSVEFYKTKLSGLNETSVVDYGSSLSLDNVKSITVFDKISSVISLKEVGGLSDRSNIASNNIRVEVSGEANNPGVYLLKRGTTLQDLFDLIGDKKDGANEEALIFTRKEIRDTQLRALSKAQGKLNSQLLEVLKSSDKESAVDLDSLEELATIDIDSENLGRIAGDFSRNSEGSQILLKDGDAIYIPTFSNSVTVIGGVFNSATFVFNPEITSSSHYISLAGGKTKDGNISQAYIIRANGESVRIRRGGWLSPVEKRLQPGDTLVIPIKLKNARSAATILSVSSIISNIAFAAASLDALKN